jgi:hypothetical protein
VIETIVPAVRRVVNVKLFGLLAVGFPLGIGEVTGIQFSQSLDRTSVAMQGLFAFHFAEQVLKAVGANVEQNSVASVSLFTFLLVSFPARVSEGCIIEGCNIWMAPVAVVQALLILHGNNLAMEAVTHGGAGVLDKELLGIFFVQLPAWV